MFFFALWASRACRIQKTITLSEKRRIFELFLKKKIFKKILNFDAFFFALWASRARRIQKTITLSEKRRIFEFFFKGNFQKNPKFSCFFFLHFGHRVHVEFRKRSPCQKKGGFLNFKKTEIFKKILNFHAFFFCTLGITCT